MKAVSLQALFALRVLCLVTLAAGQPKAPVKCSTECGRLASAIAAKRIRSYRRTEPRCAKQAIIFITLKSIEICADPEAEWVKKIVEDLDRAQAAVAPFPHDASSAAAPEELGVFQKHVGATAPSQATAPPSLFQETGPTVLTRVHIPASRMEVSSKSPPATQDTTELPAGLPPLIHEVPEENSKSSAPSRPFATGLVSSQPTTYLTALVHGFDKTRGSIGKSVGHADAMADSQDTTSPSSHSDLVAVTKESGHPRNQSLDPRSARANAPDTASGSSSSDPHSILNSMEITTVPATPLPPEATAFSTLNSAAAIDKAPSVHTNKAVSSSADAFGARTQDYSSPVGKPEPSDPFISTSQAFSGQARVQITTERPNDPPLPSFLSRSQMHFVIPVAVVSGLMVCTVAIAWLYLKFGVKREDMSIEMVQGLLYKGGHQNNVYPMKVI